MLELMCFDICAFAILVTLYFTIKGKNLSADRSGRRLAVLLGVTLISTCLSAAVTGFNYKTRDHVVIGYLLMTFYIVVRTSTFYLYAAYIVSIMGTWHRTGNEYIKTIRFIPCFLALSVSVSAPFFHAFYFYSLNGTYIRCMGYNVIYLFSGSYIVYSIYYIIRNTRFIGIRKSVALTVCSLFSFIASFIQYARPYLVVDIIGFTLSIVVIVLFIDNPDDKLEEVTGIMNRTAYFDELNMNFYTLKHFDIIQIDIKNHKALEQMLNYDKYAMILRKMSKQMSELNIKEHLNAGLYYIRDGSFRVVIDGNNYARTHEFAEEMCNLFNGEIEDNEIDISFESELVIIQCPQDFKSVEEIIDFRNTANRGETVGKITAAADIIKDHFSTQKNIDKLIEKGLVNNQFRITFKPMFDLRNGIFNCAEAELRLFDEDYGSFGPDVYRDVAEQNGTLNELGFLEIDAACKFIADNNLEELGVGVIGINLAAVQCLQKNMADTIIDTVEKYGLNKENIFFEITESVASDNQKVFTDTITRLADYGFALALDNYGTGYSNILTLSRMPFVAVKFDGAFINDYANEKLSVVVEKTVEMIKSLGKSIAIDGISNEEQIGKFKELKCDFLQGSYFGGFMEPEEFVQFIKEKRRENM